MALPVVTSYRDIGYPSGIAGGYGTGAQLMDVIAGGGAASIWTITFSDSGTFNEGEVVSVTVYDDANTGNVQTCSYTVTATVTEAAVSQGFADEWNQEIGCSNWMSAADAASVGGNYDVVLTGRVLGQAFTLAVTGQGGATVTAAETQSAADMEDVEPGRAMVQVVSSNVATYDRAKNTPIARRFKTSLFTAMSKTWAVTGMTEAASALVTRYTFQGVTRNVRTIMDADNPTTVTAHVAALETSFNATFTAGAGLVATVPTAGSVKIAVDVPGAVFEADTWVDGPEANAAAVLTETGTIYDPAYSLPAAFLGISSWQPGTAPTSIDGGNGVYAGGSGVPVWTGGSWIDVECDDSPNPNQLVYVIGDTTTPGAFTDTAGSSAVAACWPDGRQLLRWSGQYTSSTARIVKGA